MGITRTGKPVKPYESGVWPTHQGQTAGTRIDGKSLNSSNQSVPQHIVHLSEHLPWSPAAGAPTHEGEFGAGHRWTEADGKVHDGVGPGNARF